MFYNRELLTTKKIVSLGCDRKAVKKSDVDQYAAQKFNVGMNGFLENDITLVMRATSLEQLKRISQRLQEIPKNNPDNSKKSLLTITRETMSRYSQTPSELVRAQEQIYLDVLRDEREKLVQKRDEKLNDSQSDNNDSTPSSPAADAPVAQ